MKKVMKMVVGILGMAVLSVGLCGAGEKETLPIFTQTLSAGTAMTITNTSFANPVGSRILLKSLWVNGVTGSVSTIKVCPTEAITNDAPPSFTGSTMYYVPAGNLWLEGTGKILFTLPRDATNCNFGLSVFATIPE